MKKFKAESDSEEDQLLAEESEASGEEEQVAEDDSDASEAEIAEDDSEAEEEGYPDLAASSTESDDDDDDDDDEDDEEEEEAAPKSRAELIDEKIHAKYEQLKGTRLFVRFPQKLPEDVEEFNKNVKALHPLVVKSTKPRQKHARFCLVDFQTPEDRDQAFKDIKKSVETDPKFKGLFVSLPKTDSDDFVNDLVTKKQKSVENKRAKSAMKRAAKKGQRKGTFTSSVVITNLPKTSSVAQVRQLFGDVVDIQMRPGKGKYREFTAATVTLPTTHDARKAIKQKLSLAGTELNLRFNTKPKRNPKQKLTQKQKSEKGKSPAKQQKDNQKPRQEKGEAPKNKKANLKRRDPGGDKVKTPRKLKKLSAA
ncbi:hypothetical protein KR018_003725 [Drosophila ironensis]|nr:hypothetical protein KR018_003725 [Drosophila ironensis]